MFHDNWLHFSHFFCHLFLKTASYLGQSCSLEGNGKISLFLPFSYPCNPSILLFVFFVSALHSWITIRLQTNLLWIIIECVYLKILQDEDSLCGEDENFDWDSDDELEIENYRLSSFSSLKLPAAEATAGAAEVLIYNLLCAKFFTSFWVKAYNLWSFLQGKCLGVYELLWL